ncbi:hypothetical protein FRC11_003410, partial [Ceratobasidium sp. 423]
YTIIPALSLDGILHLDIVMCAATMEIFNIFIRHLLRQMNPNPGPNSVIVLDNAIIHYPNELEEMGLPTGISTCILSGSEPN